MQQVGTVSRFWWRAHDAPTPSQATPERPAPPAPCVRTAAAPLTIAATPYALQIPRGERRLHPRRRSTIRSAMRAAAMFGALTACAAGGAVALSSQALDVSLVASRIGARATTAMIALGFGIDQVSVTGQRFTADDDVFDALDLAHVRAFWNLDAEAALKRIERIAWVDTAQITRVYPGRLDIEIRERRPAALWSRGDAQYLVDATGRVLGPVGGAHGWALPRIAGEGANADAALLLAALSRHPELAKRVATSERVAERRWRVVLNNGSRIELAAEREVEGIDQVAEASALRQALAGEPVVIDVRTQGRIAVRPLTNAVASAAIKQARQP